MISRFENGPITFTPYVDFLTRHLSSSQPQPTYTTTFMTTLTPTDIKTLEQTRQRLSQLTNSLASLQQSLLQSDPLPSWYNPFPLPPSPFPLPPSPFPLPPHPHPQQTKLTTPPTQQVLPDLPNHHPRSLPHLPLHPPHNQPAPPLRPNRLPPPLLPRPHPRSRAPTALAQEARARGGGLGG
jgi:hypothetical protein